MTTEISQLPLNVRAFLDTPKFGVLATLRPDGSPQQTVMWWKRDGDRIMMNTLSGRAKDRYLTQDGRASLCVEDAQYYVSFDGVVEIDRDPEHGQQTVRVIAAHYDGDASADKQMREVFADQHRITLYLTPTRIDFHGFEE